MIDLNCVNEVSDLNNRKSNNKNNKNILSIWWTHEDDSFEGKVEFDDVQSVNFQG